MKTIHLLTLLSFILLIALAGCNRAPPQTPEDRAGQDFIDKVQDAAASGTPPEIAGEQLAKELFAPCNPGEKTVMGDGLFESETFGKQMKAINGQTYEICYFTQTDLRIKDHPDLDIRQTATAHFYSTEEFMLAKDGGISYKTFIDETGTNRIIIERLSYTKGLCTAEVSDPAPPTPLTCINGDTY